MTSISVPRDLRPAGRALLRRLGGWLGEQDLVLDPHEETVLLEACRVADRLAQLRDVLADADLTDPPVVRLIAEERQQRQALAHLLLTKLGLPTGVAAADGPVGATPRSRRAQTAAHGRWGGSHAS